jgi:hypothetical protein
MERPPENDGVWTTMAAARAFPGATRELLARLADDGIWAARMSQSSEVTIVRIDTGAHHLVKGGGDAGHTNRP